MKRSKKNITINHNADNLFDIVIDIEKYPEFIPWCTGMHVHSKNKKEILADMHVVYKFFIPQKFGSHVFFNKKKLNIKTIYTDGPLKDLKTDWQFKSINKKKTIVVFTVEFEFKKFLHQKLAETFFPLIENKMINSFIKRANDILN